MFLKFKLSFPITEKKFKYDRKKIDFMLNYLSHIVGLINSGQFAKRWPMFRGKVILCVLFLQAYGFRNRRRG